MFSTTSENKSKRKSFFLFGSDKEIVPEPIHSNTSTVRNTYSHQTTRKSVPSSNNSINRDKKRTNTDNAQHLDSNTFHEKSTNSNPSQENKVGTDYLSNTNIKRMPGSIRENIRRPPPPVMNLDEIRRSVDEKVRTLPNESVNSFQSSSSKISKEHHTNQDSKPKDLEIVENVKGGKGLPNSSTYMNTENIYQHKRERSQAEELVDDIDLYLKSYKESSLSASQLLVSTQTDESLPNKHFGSISDISHELENSIPDNSPIVEVSPLEIQSSNIISGLYSSSEAGSSSSKINSPKSNDYTEMREGQETERFSFIGSESTESSHHILEYVNDVPSSLENKNTFKSTNPFMIDSDSQSSPSSKPLRIVNADTFSSIQPLNEEKDNVPSNYRKTSAESGSMLEEEDEEYTHDETVELEPRHNFRVVNEDRPTFYTSFDDMNETSSFSSHNLPTAVSPNHLLTDFLDPSSSPSKSPYLLIPSDDTSNPATTSTEKGLSNLHLSNDTSILKFSEFSSQKELPNEKLPKLTNTPSSKSSRSVNSVSQKSARAEKPSKLVSSHVEELRLKYYKTSNFLEAPPNLPMSLKQKNNLIHPKNIKVAVRTSSKQIGIKHGRIKQKLLTMETNSDDTKSLGSSNISGINHTKEFHKLLGKEDALLEEDENNSEEYLNEIPGDEAYDSEDYMAPLREKKGSSTDGTLTRSNTTVSYFTKLQNRPRSGTVDKQKTFHYKLPTNILDEYKEDEKNKNSSNSTERILSTKSYDSTAFMESYTGEGGLFVANPDSDDDE